MSNIHKMTFVFLIVIVTFCIFLFLKTQTQSSKHEGSIKSLELAYTDRTDLNFIITLPSSTSIILKINEISPLFNAKKYLGLQKNDQISYTLNKSGEVISFHNLTNNRQISMLFYTINRVLSTFLINITVFAFAGIQFFIFVLNSSSLVKSNPKLNSFNKIIDRVNDFFRRNKLVMVITFILFFLSLFYGARYFELFIEPAQGLSATKYILEFITLFLLLLFFVGNIFMERNILQK